MKEVSPVIQAYVDSINTRISTLENKAKDLRLKTIKLYNQIEEIRAELHEVQVEHLCISNRAYNLLKKHKITTIGRLMELGKRGLLRIPGISNVTLTEIRGELENLGLDLPYMSVSVNVNQKDLRDGDSTAAKLRSK